ncbi:co-chaperone GroES [Candidatus Parcubacteria bacterium]|nr:co-chaperone GroES [Candidatus Parcubacteria bacterium]
MSDKQKGKKPSVVPLGDRVLVRGIAGEGKRSASGIIIPETVSKERPEKGRVIAVGAGRTTDEGRVIPLRVKVGDTVLFSKYGPDEVKIEGEEYFIIREENILAIIK